jgi:hypothetical protein
MVLQICQHEALLKIEARAVKLPNTTEFKIYQNSNQKQKSRHTKRFLDRKCI